MALKDHLETGKAILDFGKQAAIVVIVVSFVAWPSLIAGQLKTFMKTMGIKEFDVSGFKGETDLINLSEELRLAKASNGDLEAKLTAIKTELQRAVGSGTTTQTASGRVPASEPAAPAQRSVALQSVIEQVNTALSVAAATSNLTQRALDNAAPAVSAAQTALGTGGGWVIIFSADNTEAAAKPELEKAARLDVGTPNLYLRQKWYRGGLVFRTQADAQKQLGLVQRQFRDAYPVNLATWCPAPVATPTGVLDCRI